ncbi:MAG: hypothetical protein LBU34_10910 [Planctomycetaceae bacterium]|nr:hypothetical protein [Planctomycetaceae bacterium]
MEKTNRNRSPAALTITTKGTPKMSTNTAQQFAENPSQTLDQKIDETRRFIRHIDLFLSFFSLLTILFAVLFAAVLADHWFFADGLSMSLRFGIFAVILFIFAFYIYRRIVPLLLYPINPVYAASLLEESTPSLKNSIVNWILLRKERLEQENTRNDKLAERMFDGVTQTAVSNAHNISSERAVDLRSLTRWGIALTLCFLFFVAYAVFSPKSPLTSLARIILPISNIEKPQAVRFLNIEPGNTVALQGEKLTVSAEVAGQSNEPVYLFFSTDDGQFVRQAIPMSLPEGKTRYEVSFPPGKQGFTGSVDYWIAQDDSRSGTFRIEVRPTASIEIASLNYRFPPYTGLPDATVENSGDIRAVEGTEVKIGVRSTLPLQRIDMVFDNDPVRIVGMKLSDNNPSEAAATITLKLDPKNTNSTTIRKFLFRATDLEGYESRRSGIFRIEVLPDQPPNVQWADTDTKLKDVAQLDLPLNSSLELPIQAEDRDFGLRYLRFHVESGNKQIRPVELLESSATGPTEYKGSIQRKAVFSPITSRLAEGDSAEIWAEAVDTKFPDPNNATTRRITVRIVAPQKQEQPPRENEQKPDGNDNDNKEKQGKEQDKDPNKDNERNNDIDKEQQQQDKEQPENKQREQEKDQNSQDNADNREPNDRSNDNPSEKPEDNDENDENDKENGQKQDGEQTGEKNEQQQQSGDTQNGGKENEREQGKESGEQDNSNEPNREPSEAGENTVGNNSGDNTDNNKTDKNKTDTSKDDSGKEDSEQKQDNPSSKGERQNNTANNTGNNTDNNTAKKPVNPETQDGDAMEEIIKQMKKEGKFDDKKPNDRNNGNNEQGNNNRNDNNQSDTDQGSNNQNRNQQDINEQSSNRKEKNQKEKENQTDSKQPDSMPDSKQGQQNQSDQGSGKEGEPASEQSDSQSNEATPNDKANPTDTKNSGQTNNSEQSSNSEQSNNDEQTGNEPANSGGNRQEKSKPASEFSDKQGDDRKTGEQVREVPVDPADKSLRQRDDSLDPNSKQRSNQGNDSDKPKKSDIDTPNNSVSGGNEGKNQEAQQQEQNSQTQSAEQSKTASKSENGVEKRDGEKQDGKEQNGTAKNTQSDENKPEAGQSNQSDCDESGNNQNNSNRDNSNQGSSNQSNSNRNNSNQGLPNQSDLPEGGNTASGKNQSGENQLSKQPQDSASNTLLPEGGQGASVSNVETPPEDPNLEYTKKVTNLVLEYLEDQLKAKPNQELLDNLGWTEEELRDFYRKWQEMSEQSKRSESQTSNDDIRWKEAFKSLGLKPAHDRQQLQKSRTEVQDKSKVTESQRFVPPSAIKERFKRYTEGIGK